MGIVDTNLHTKADKDAADKMMAETRRAASIVADADHDGSLAVDFAEFCAMLPPNMLERFSEEELRGWFSIADINKDGNLAVEEFFVWTLINGIEKHGDDVVRTLFAQYDPDGSGFIDVLEFQKVCDEAGFGLVSSAIFRNLDPDGSGQISYRELVQTLERTRPAGKEERKRLNEIIWAYDEEQKAETARVTSSTEWRLTGETAGELMLNMHALLQEKKAQVVDIILMFDIDSGVRQHIDEMEFNRALRNKFGFRGRLEAIDELFAQLDTDRSGHVGFDELYEFIRGKRHSLDKRNKRVRAMTMAPPAGCGYTLEMIAWDEDVLREQVHRMMERCHIGCADIVRAWDANGDGELGEKEFVDHLRPFFKGSEALWAHEIERLAKSTFNARARKAGESKIFAPKLSATELEEWLRKADSSQHDAPPPLRADHPAWAAPAAEGGKAPAAAPAAAAAAAKKKATLAEEAIVAKKALARRQDPATAREAARELRRQQTAAQGPPKPSEKALESPIFRAMLSGRRDRPAAGGAAGNAAAAHAESLDRMVDVRTIVDGHARFWTIRSPRWDRAARRLPPISPRSARGQAITATLPRWPEEGRVRELAF